MARWYSYNLRFLLVLFKYLNISKPIGLCQNKNAAKQDIGLFRNVQNFTLFSHLVLQDVFSAGHPAEA
jgi:hypothetical protein